MSETVLVVMEQRAGAWTPMSMETLAAGQQLASALGQPVSAAVPGRDIRQPRRRAFLQGARHGVRRRTRTAGRLHGGWLHGRPRTTDPARRAGLGTFPAHLPGARLRRPAGGALRAGADQRCCGDAGRRTAPVFVRQLFQGKLNARCPAGRRGSALRLVPGGGVPRGYLAGGHRAGGDVQPELAAAQIRQHPEPPFRETTGAVDLTAAELIVAVGRGIKEKDNIPHRGASWRGAWVRNWRPRVRSATTVGFPPNGRWAAPARRFRRRSMWRWGSRAPSSISSG